MPKSLRSAVAEAQASTMDEKTSTGDDIFWSKILSLASVVSSRDLDSSTTLASIVRSTLLKFNSSLPALTVLSPSILRVSNMSPTQTLLSNVHRRLSLGDVSPAICLIASDNSDNDVTSEVLHDYRLKHPVEPVDSDLPPFPADISGFSASENDAAKVLWHFAVGSSSGIDVLRPAHPRDLTSNSTAEAGQHLMRSLTALVNRIPNADVSDHARKLLFSANLTALRRKDGGIRPIAVCNVHRRHATRLVAQPSHRRSFDNILLRRLVSACRVRVRLQFIQYGNM